MAERFDVVVIGAGPGGEVVADRLLAAGRSVALVERELIGGECAYWACIPSKVLVRGPEVRAEAAQVPGAGTPDLDWQRTSDWRDTMIRHLDDAKQVASYEQQGMTVVKGEARLAGPGKVEVDGRQLEATDIVLATGSASKTPPMEVGDGVEVWTNREATTLTELPGRAVFVGGGPVGVELSQFLARFDVEVTLVQSPDTLVNREDPRVGELLRAALEADGVTVKTGVKATRARRDGATTVVELDDGTTVGTDAFVAAAGRRPRVDDLGLGTVGLDPDAGLEVDDRLRVGDGLWAVGDVTGVMPFTHVAKYQARVLAANLLGGDRRARYDGIPRVVFSSPEVAAAGLTAARARERGIDVVTTELDLTAAIARPWTYSEQPQGTMGLLVDRARRVLVGAWAVAPLASEWIHEPALAIRAGVPLDVLLDGVAQFPTWSEGFLSALEQLDL